MFVSVLVVTLFVQALKSYHSQKSERGELLAFSSTHARVKVHVFRVAAALGLGQKEVLQKRDENGNSTAHDKPFCVHTTQI